MKKGLLAVGLAGLSIFVLLLLRNSPSRPIQPLDQSPATSPSAVGTTTSVTSVPRNAAGSSAPQISNAATSQPAPPLNLSAGPARSSVAPTPVGGSRVLEFTNAAPESVMENLRGVFRQFNSMFNGNPTGINSEITRALNGDNPKQVKFLREDDGLRVNENGELIDPWGTPFFFHQLSASQMEIHCAGPDGVMWTTDDLVSK